MILTAEELLAGGQLTFEISLPAEVLSPGQQDDSSELKSVRLKPLTVQELQFITRASKEKDSLLAALMVHKALIEPEMQVTEVLQLHVGLLSFLLNEVKRISGMEVSEEVLEATIEAPLAKASFILAKQYGWTPQEVSELTLGQVLFHLQMLNGEFHSEN